MNTAEIPQQFRHLQNYINGTWQAAKGGACLAVTNPATGLEIGTTPLSGADETRIAIEAAARAFPSWAALSAQERAGKLHALVREIEQNADDLAHLLTLEQGKPLAEARGEILGGAAYIRWFAEETRRIYGDIIPSPWTDRRLLVTRGPVGVVAAITPWNFPFSMIARKLGAALAAGCTIVIKPSELTPFSGLAWGELCARAGIPAGVVNLLTGDAAAIGAVMTSHPAVRKITFTGSTRVGKLLAGAAGREMKRFSMELGGNAPFIVMDDADLDAAAAGAIAAKFRNAGQTCVCVNRFYVQRGVYEAFAEKLAHQIRNLKVGSGFEPEVTQGPLINTAAMEKVAAHIEDACAKGGRVLVGGKPSKAGAQFFEPTLIADGTREMMVARDETFGPLAVLFPFDTDEDAISLANDTEYGLAAYVYTQGLSRAVRLSEALEYGMVGVNAGIITTEVAPFGGVKASGVGREGSRYGLDDYLDLKYVSLGGL